VEFMYKNSKKASVGDNNNKCIRVEVCQKKHSITNERIDAYQETKPYFNKSQV
jgi:hypothetical protein